MERKNRKIIHEENYMKRNNIGEDLFLASQVLINLDTEEWIQLSLRSRIFLKDYAIYDNYKVCKKTSDE
ncbi:MAG: hypothetical protein ACI398_04920 [Clostridium sp.]